MENHPYYVQQLSQVVWQQSGRTATAADVDAAIAFTEENNKAAAGKKRKELAQLDISQKPLSPRAAFAERKTSEFPIDKLRKQQERILLKEKENTWDFKPLKGLFEENTEGTGVVATSKVLIGVKNITLSQIL